MTQRRVHSDPAQMRQFQVALKRTVSQLKDIRLSLTRQLAATDWQDSQRARFEEEFVQTMATLIKFVENCETNHIVYLERQIRTLEEYLRRR